jgi:hypothetical protein
MEIQQREIELYNLQDQGIMDKIHRQVVVPYLLFKMSDGTSIAPGIRMMSRAPYFCDKCIDKTIERRRQLSPPCHLHTHIKLFGQYLWHKHIIWFAVACQRPNLSNYGTKLHVADINPGWAVIKIGAQITGGSQKAKQSVLMHSHDPWKSENQFYIYIYIYMLSSQK